MHAYNKACITYGARDWGDWVTDIAGAVNVTAIDPEPTRRRTVSTKAARSNWLSPSQTADVRKYNNNNNDRLTAIDPGQPG